MVFQFDVVAIFMAHAVLKDEGFSGTEHLPGGRNKDRKIIGVQAIAPTLEAFNRRRCTSQNTYNSTGDEDVSRLGIPVIHDLLACLKGRFVPRLPSFDLSGGALTVINIHMHADGSHGIAYAAAFHDTAHPSLVSTSNAPVWCGRGTPSRSKDSGLRGDV